MRIQIIVPTVKSYNEYRVVDILYTFARYLLSIFKFPNTRILKLLFEKQKIYLEIMTTLLVVFDFYRNSSHKRLKNNMYYDIIVIRRFFYFSDLLATKKGKTSILVKVTRHFIEIDKKRFAFLDCFKDERN